MVLLTTGCVPQQRDTSVHPWVECPTPALRPRGQHRAAASGMGLGHSPARCTGSLSRFGVGRIHPGGLHPCVRGSSHPLCPETVNPIQVLSTPTFSCSFSPQVPVMVAHSLCSQGFHGAGEALPRLGGSGEGEAPVPAETAIRSEAGSKRSRAFVCLHISVLK